MDRFKHHGILDAYAHQIRDIEKAPIVDSFVDVLPIRQYIILFRQQAIQVAKTGSMVSPAVENSQIVPHKSLHLAVCVEQLAQPLFDPRNLKAPLAGCIHSQRIPLRQRGQRSDNSQILLKRARIRTELLFEYVFSMLQNPAVRFRSQGKRHVVIFNRESSAPKDDLELAVVKSLAVETAEHGQQDFVIERERRRMPIDIEISCVS